jgi:hypothetical protein
LITVNRLDFDDDVPFRQAAGRGLAAFGVRPDFAFGAAGNDLADIVIKR